MRRGPAPVPGAVDPDAAATVQAACRLLAAAAEATPLPLGHQRALRFDPASGRFSHPGVDGLRFCVADGAFHDHRQKLLEMDGATAHDVVEAIVPYAADEETLRRTAEQLQGGRFRSGRQARAGVLQALRGAEARLTTWARGRPEAGPVLVWPEGLELSVDLVLALGEAPDGSDAKALTVGWMAAGTRGRPQWFVAPWPYPRRPRLPALTQGHWHHGDWLGAVLDAAEPDDVGVASFLREAELACHPFTGCAVRADCGRRRVLC